MYKALISHVHPLVKLVQTVNLPYYTFLAAAFPDTSAEICRYVHMQIMVMVFFTGL